MIRWSCSKFSLVRSTLRDLLVLLIEDVVQIVFDTLHCKWDCNRNIHVQNKFNIHLRRYLPECPVSSSIHWSQCPEEQNKSDKKMITQVYSSGFMCFKCFYGCYSGVARGLYHGGRLVGQVVRYHEAGSLFTKEDHHGNWGGLLWLLG